MVAGMTTATNQLGQRGEEIAARYLESLGYVIAERNARLSVDELRGEFDVIAWDGRTLVFCEVKTRRVSADGDDALLGVTPLKQRQLRRLAGAYLARLDGPISVRCDVVGVSWRPAGGPPQVAHVIGAF